MTGGAAPKTKGDIWERAVVAYTTARGYTSTRLFGAGRPDDLADIRLTGYSQLFIECKNAKKHELARWLDVLRTKCCPWPGAIPVLVVKRPRRGPDDAYVVLDLHGFLDLLEQARQN